MIRTRLLHAPDEPDASGIGSTVGATQQTAAPTPAPAIVTAPTPKEQRTNAETPRQPTAAELKQEFKLEQLGDLEIALPTIAKAEPKAAEAAKVEPKEEPKIDAEPKAEPVLEKTDDALLPPSRRAKPVAGATKQGERDYTVFNAQEQEVLKQMSNPAFEFTTKLLKQNKELEQQKGPATIFQHPQGYTLDPGFQQLQQQGNLAKYELGYWQDALKKMAAGEEWQMISGYKNGEPVFETALRKPTSQDQEYARLAASQCMQIMNQSQQQLQGYVGQYQQKIQQDTAAMQAERAKRFGWVAKPEMLEDELELDGGKRKMKDVRNDIINLLPPYHRNSPLADLVADMFVGMVIQGIDLREARAGKKVAEIKTDEARRQEPSPTTRPAADVKTINGVKTFSLDGLPK